jgi:hypothetical protein
MEGPTFQNVRGHNTVAAPHASHGGTININSTTHYNSDGNGEPSVPPAPCSTVPFVQDDDFVDRPEIITQIEEKCSRPAGRVALVGLGGVG